MTGLVRKRLFKNGRGYRKIKSIVGLFTEDRGGSTSEDERVEVFGIRRQRLKGRKSVRDKLIKQMPIKFDWWTLC